MNLAPALRMLPALRRHLPDGLAARVHAAGSVPAAPRPDGDAGGVALLTEILARLGYPELPVVQFVPTCDAEGHGAVARLFAGVAVERLGRVLMLSGEHGDAPGGAEALSSRLARLLGSTDTAATPDVAIPGLHHGKIGGEDWNRPELQAARAQMFGMIVVQSARPHRAPESLIQARRCHGTVLTVAAGQTPSAAVMASARQVQQVGATLLGTVLWGAPARSARSFHGR